MDALQSESIIVATTVMVSKAQIDRLGHRLRKGNITEADLRMLDEYRRSFSDAYEFVVGSVRTELGLEPTGRPAKSTTSISEKLQRESIRLTQVQDIAGCRLIVTDIGEQEKMISSLESLFPDSNLVDRREQPSHGYRAIHLIVVRENKLVEIQLRTGLQHTWAELSEKISDIVDPAIKYGGGNEEIRLLLTVLSNLIFAEESLELKLSHSEVTVSDLLSRDDLGEEKQKMLADLRKELDDLRKVQLLTKADSLKILATALNLFPSPEGESNVISN